MYHLAPGLNCTELLSLHYFLVAEKLEFYVMINILVELLNALNVYFGGMIIHMLFLLW